MRSTSLLVVAAIAAFALVAAAAQPAGNTTATDGGQPINATVTPAPGTNATANATAPGAPATNATAGNATASDQQPAEQRAGGTGGKAKTSPSSTIAANLAGIPALSKLSQLLQAPEFQGIRDLLAKAPGAPVNQTGAPAAGSKLPTPQPSGQQPAGAASNATGGSGSSSAVGAGPAYRLRLLADANATTTSNTTAGAVPPLTLNATGPFTVFAPSDDAFNAFLRSQNMDPSMNLSQVFALLPENDRLRIVATIYYHILNQNLSTSAMKAHQLPRTILQDPRFVNLPGGKSQKLHVMAEGHGAAKKAMVWWGLTKNARENKANVVLADIASSNGIIHVIDKIVEVPDIPSKLLTDGGLTKFLDAVKNDSSLQQKMDNSTGVTVFAPLNEAFNLEKGQASQNLSAVLNKLILNGLFYFKENSSGDVISQLKTNDTDDDIAGSNVTMTRDRGAQAAAGDRNVRGNATAGGAPGNATAPSNATGGAEQNASQWKISGTLGAWKVDGASVITHDVVTKNGVLHVIDRIIGLPETKKKVPYAGGFVSNISCSDLNCPSGDECCDMSIDAPNLVTPRCFNPKTHVCASRGNFLCGINAPLVCGLHCYNASQYVCVNSLLLCPVSSPYACGVACYDAAMYKCQSGMLAPLGADQRSPGDRSAGGAGVQGAQGAQGRSGAAGAGQQPQQPQPSGAAGQQPQQQPRQ